MVRKAGVLQKAPTSECLAMIEWRASKPYCGCCIPQQTKSAPGSLYFILKVRESSVFVKLKMNH